MSKNVFNKQTIADDDQQQSVNPQRLGRRRLLKILAASGAGLTTAALLPEEWVSPVIEAGVLPAHAQISGTATAVSTTTPTSTPTPTETPIPYIITTCSAARLGGGVINAGDTIVTFCVIDPADANIQIRRTITVTNTATVIDVVTGVTDGTGTYAPADFTLTATNTGDTVEVLWEFVVAGQGSGSCDNTISLP